MLNCLWLFRVKTIQEQERRNWEIRVRVFPAWRECVISAVNGTCAGVPRDLPCTRVIGQVSGERLAETQKARQIIHGVEAEVRRGLKNIEIGIRSKEYFSANVVRRPQDGCWRIIDEGVLQQK